MQAQSQKRCAVKGPAAQVFENSVQSSMIKCRLERLSNTRKNFSYSFMACFSFDTPNPRPTEKATETILHAVKLEKQNKHSETLPRKIEANISEQIVISSTLGQPGLGKRYALKFNFFLQGVVVRPIIENEKP